MARGAAVVIGGVAIVLAIPAQSLNVAFLVALAFAVAASANLPSILYNMFWRRFNTRGAVWAIYGGLISAVGLVFFSPIVSRCGDRYRTVRRPRQVVVPAEQPGDRVDPGRLLLRVARHGHRPGAGRRGAVHRARGPRADRCRVGAGGRPLARSGGLGA